MRLMLLVLICMGAFALYTFAGPELYQLWVALRHYGTTVASVLFSPWVGLAVVSAVLTGIASSRDA